MPLITSPIDGSAMKQIHRYGIEIDVCPTSGGIWLDRGELEKLMALLKEDTPYESRGTYRKRHDNDDDDGYRNYGYSHKGYKKKDKFSKIMEIFDF